MWEATTVRLHRGFFPKGNLWPSFRASARGGEKASSSDRTLALADSAAHTGPAVQADAFASLWLPKGTHGFKGKHMELRAWGLHLQHLKEGSLVPFTLPMTLAATLTVDYKSLKYPFSFLDVQTDNMRGNRLKWMLKDKRKCPTSMMSMRTHFLSYL